MIPHLPALRKRLEDYCESRDRMLSLLAHARQAQETAETVAREVGLYGLPADVSPRYHGEESVRREIDRRLWRLAFDQTGVMQFMDQQAVAEFERSLEKEPPAFTLANATSIFLDQYQHADEMFVRGLVNVFGRLSGNYRSNDPFKLSRKIVLDYMCAPRWRGDGVEVRGYLGGSGDTLNDMDRVFHVLDGQKHQPRRLEVAMNAAFATNETYEDQYFRAKGYKKGTLHVWFLREDLLDKGNRMIGDYFDGRAVAKAREAA